MIRVNGAEVEIEGDVGLLMKEIAAVIASIADTVAKKFPEEDITVDDILEVVGKEIKVFQEFSKTGEFGVPEKYLRNFMKEYFALIEENRDNEFFLNYNSEVPDEDETKSIITGAIKEVFKKKK